MLNANEFTSFFIVAFRFLSCKKSRWNLNVRKVSTIDLLLYEPIKVAWRTQGSDIKWIDKILQRCWAVNSSGSERKIWFSTKKGCEIKRFTTSLQDRYDEITHVESLSQDRTFYQINRYENIENKPNPTSIILQWHEKWEKEMSFLLTVTSNNRKFIMFTACIHISYKL